MNLQKQEKWHKRYVALAEHISQWSDDRSTQVGAVIVGPNNRVVSVGPNGFPSGVVDSPERHERPDKYLYMEHAERNAIYNARLIPEGSVLYMNYYPCPCSDCARAIIQSGIRAIVGPDKPFPGKGNGVHYDAQTTPITMLKEAGVKLIVIGE